MFGGVVTNKCAVKVSKKYPKLGPSRLGIDLSYILHPRLLVERKQSYIQIIVIQWRRLHCAQASERPSHPVTTRPNGVSSSTLAASTRHPPTPPQPIMIPSELRLQSNSQESVINLLKVEQSSLMRLGDRTRAILGNSEIVENCHCSSASEFYQLRPLTLLQHRASQMTISISALSYADIYCFPHTLVRRPK